MWRLGINGGEWSAVLLGCFTLTKSYRYRLNKSLGIPGPVWTLWIRISATGENTKTSCTVVQPRASSLYRLSYSGLTDLHVTNNKMKVVLVGIELRVYCVEKASWKLPLVCEVWGFHGTRETLEFGRWRNYVSSKRRELVTQRCILEKWNPLLQANYCLLSTI